LIVFLSLPFNRYIHFLIKSDYLSNPLLTFLFNSGKVIWVDMNKAAPSLFAAIKQLQKGEVLAVFPEGGRSRDGKLRKGKNGVAALSLSSKAPIIPVGIAGSYNILPPGRFFPRLARCNVNIGAPLNFDEYYQEYNEAIKRKDHPRVSGIEEEVTRRIMTEIARLSEQEYPY